MPLNRNELTTCCGHNCERSHECLRCVGFEEHDLDRFCYSGFTFFKMLEVEQEDD